MKIDVKDLLLRIQVITVILPVLWWCRLSGTEGFISNMQIASFTNFAVPSENTVTF